MITNSIAFNPLTTSLITLLIVRVLGILIFLDLWIEKREQKHLLLIIGWLFVTIGSAWGLYTHLYWDAMEHTLFSLLAALGTFWIGCGILAYFQEIDIIPEFVNRRFLLLISGLIVVYGLLPFLGVGLGPSPGIFVQLSMALLVSFAAVCKRRAFLNVAHSSYTWLVVLAVLWSGLTLAFVLGVFGPDGLALGFAGTTLVHLVAIIFFLHLESSTLKSEREKLTQSNQELEAFNYSVSHDLRAPLRHINGYIDLLIKRFPDSLPENGRHYLEKIVASTNEMGVLIDSLLQFSRTSHKKMHQTRIDMNDLVQEALVNLESDYQNRDITWQVSSLPEVFGDRYLLKLVWQNLLSNAIKYTQQKDQAQVEIGFMDESGENIFFIRDNGVGFDMKYYHKLFGAFQRLHSTREFQGTGIGLANMRRIIQRHSGRTWAEGELEHGATFYFSLPIAE